MKSQKSIDSINKQLKQSNPLFTVINNNIIRDPNQELDTKDLIGCEINCKCIRNTFEEYLTSDENYCECSYNKCFVHYNYDSSGLLINWQKPIYECGCNCYCGQNQQLTDSCLNRVTQYRAKCSTEVFFDQSKGYSVRALSDIKSGQFVGEYCGEVIDRGEALNRFQLYNDNKEEHNYILIFREHFGTESTFEIIIDARYYGSECRFINHSCDPNLVALPVRSDSLRPRICLFASKDIVCSQELSYNYGSSESLLSNKLCFCNSEKCKRFMPLDFSL